ncbi:hypothetical protein AZC_0949 [Azorhizobium caulinodans ORS 571]|uniref:Uncharacterized protein n=2 Tax=Azorhizobium caulinodans TaxID=7 RepID=A8HUI1_AZOC5|nr:hypothetical protein [Azorhizobium caulinodans]BAF86947.1 hypothetical protein AZC_0949 [Azorhizobium caulinodans ORS 571]
MLRPSPASLTDRLRHFARLALALAALMAAPVLARAQDLPRPPGNIGGPGLSAPMPIGPAPQGGPPPGGALPFVGATAPPTGSFSGPGPAPAQQGGGSRNAVAAPSREPHAILPQAPAGKVTLGVFARFGADGATVPRAVMWRVFADTPEASGAFPLVAESTEATPVFFLSPGGYIVHLTYGYATQAQRVVLGATSRREAFILPAGGLRLQADVDNKAITNSKVSFDIYEGSFLQGRTSSQPLYRGALPNEVVLLPEGTYHVVSTYGDANAVVRADVTVQAGKLTDAMVHHRAAQITLKLVKEAGGEALADTQWSVITPGGDTIKESIGAFPTVVLTEGEYVAIARNDGRVVSRDFKVELGKDKDVEVLASGARATTTRPLTR